MAKLKSTPQKATIFKQNPRENISNFLQLQIILNIHIN